MVIKANQNHTNPNHRGHCERDNDVAGCGEHSRDHADQVAYENENEDCEDPWEKGHAFFSECVAHDVGDVFIKHFSH